MADDRVEAILGMCMALDIEARKARQASRDLRTVALRDGQGGTDVNGRRTYVFRVGHGEWPAEFTAAALVARAAGRQHGPWVAAKGAPEGRGGYAWSATPNYPI